MSHAQVISSPYDLIFRGGNLIDGSGKKRYQADLAVAGQKVVAIGDLSNSQANANIDIRGKILAPGFIDAHSHDDRMCIDHPEMTAKISQGVTTVIVGNCGMSLAPLKKPRCIPEPLNLLGTAEDFEFDHFSDYVEAVDDAKPNINVAALVGHNTLRIATMDDLDKSVSAAELDEMLKLVVAAMESGAVGISSGFFYGPGQSADNDEIIPLAMRAATYGGVYATHIRDEYDLIVESLNEACDAASGASIPVVISHHKCAGVQNWGRSVETLALLEEKSKHQTIFMDCYPYDAGSSVLDPDLVDDRIEILVTWSQTCPQMSGKYLSEIAAQWQCSQREAAVRLKPGGACYFQMHEDDVERILCHPSTMVGSDGLPNDPHPHPRLWGAFPRVLGRYVRDKGLLTLEQAVHKMTGMAAQLYGLTGRGELTVGAFADLVVFDPETVSDKATYESPRESAAGIEIVCVNGAIAWRHQENTMARSGGFVRRST